MIDTKLFLDGEEETPATEETPSEEPKEETSETAQTKTCAC